MTRIRLFASAPDAQTDYARRMVAALIDAGHAAELSRFTEAPTDMPGTAVLVHRPSALEPGLSPTAHAALSDAERILLPLAPRIVVASEAVAARLTEAFGVASARMAIVPPGVDPAPRGSGSGTARCAILSAGALVPRKGHDVLLRALAGLHDLDWHLTIVGTPERHPAHAEALRAMVGDLAIGDRVRFVAAADADEMEALWQRADVFALATQWEADYGATAAALRHGVPVAVCGGGAAATLMTPQAGAVVSPGDAEGLSKVLRRMIFDRAMRADLAEAAWRLGDKLPTWPQQAARLATMLSTAAAA